MSAAETGISRSAPAGDGSVRLVLGYAHLPPAEIERAVRLLPAG
ncbi:hypothetical protein [Streptomyces xinghaiensis]|nr:hypothetical protein [Streptomyces xinghaiensis]